MTSKYRKLHRRIRRHGTEGMTLVEIMIVVIIMALIATAVGVAVLPQLEKSRIKDTEIGVQAVRGATTMFLAENPAGGCPSIDDLIEGAYLDEDKSTTDAWEGEFDIECSGTRVTVTSAGPDKQFGTDDDIQ